MRLLLVVAALLLSFSAAEAELVDLKVSYTGSCSLNEVKGTNFKCRVGIVYLSRKHGIGSFAFDRPDRSVVVYEGNFWKMLTNTHLSMAVKKVKIMKDGKVIEEYPLAGRCILSAFTTDLEDIDALECDVGDYRSMFFARGEKIPSRN